MQTNLILIDLMQQNFLAYLYALKKINMKYRIEKDTMGEVKVPADAIMAHKPNAALIILKLHRISTGCQKKSSGHLLI